MAFGADTVIELSAIAGDAETFGEKKLGYFLYFLMYLPHFFLQPNLWEFDMRSIFQMSLSKENGYSMVLPPTNP